MYHGSLTFGGQNVGAKSYHNIKKIVRYGVIAVSVIGLSIGGLMFVFHKPLINLYAPNNPEVMTAALARMRIIMFTYFICGIMEVFCGAMRAMGKSITAMVISLCGACGFRILWILTVFQLFHTQTGLYLVYPCSWLLTVAVYVIFFGIALRRLLLQKPMTVDS